MRHATILAAGMLILATTPVLAQSTVGYTDPTDLDALLGYRLPDWGWRTWDVDGGFHGDGHRSSTSATNGDSFTSSASRNALGLDTQLDLYRESERLTLAGSVELAGSWSHRHQSNDWDDSSRRQVAGRYGLSVDGDVYLGATSWFATGHLQTSGSYTEIREAWEQEEYRSIDKGHYHAADLGLGLGRIRDVTPLIRAQRLSERLAALGRPRLTPQQVQQVARVLAQEFGYRIVFDRPDRRFWRDVLDPILAGEPLSVAEIFYLTDVLQEDLGPRRQGMLVEAVATWYQSGLGDEAVHRPGVSVRAEISSNRSLSLQVRGYLSGRWSETRDGSLEGTFRVAAGGGDLLWNVADRLRLDAALRGTLSESERWGTTYWRRTTSAEVELPITLNVYIEDRLTLRPYAAGRWWELRREDDDAGNDGRSWSWEYGVVVNYRLDGVLF